MKRTIVALFCAFSMVSAGAFAAEAKKKPAATPKKKPMVEQVDSGISGQGYGMAGCGLGSIAFGEKPGMIQVVAATLNGTFGSQTFGISTGTSNCEGTKGSTHAALFIVANKESVEKDVARGSGETIATLSGIMSCSDAALLGTELKKNYGEIFPAGSTDVDTISRNLLNTVKSNPQLAQSCDLIG